MHKSQVAVAVLATISLTTWAADVAPDLKIVHADAAMPRLEVISKAEHEIAGARFVVEKFKNLAGQVCQEYVSSSYRAGNGPVEVEVDTYCNQPMTRNGVLYPAGLASMEWVKSSDSGLGIHMLTIDSLMR